MGRLLVPKLAAGGFRVLALARSEASAIAAEELGAEGLRGDLDHPATLAGIVPAGARLLYLAPPADGGAQDSRVEHLLGQACSETQPGSLVYLSTTGVYGDRGGDWIDESAAPCPASDRGRRRLDAECRLKAYAQARKIPLTILRVSGIYGPQRLPLARLKQGMAVPPAAQSAFVNLIHEEDLVRALTAALDSAEPERVVNVADGRPLPMSRYFERLAEAFELPAPRVLPLNELKNILSPAMLSYFRESKRLRNEALKRLLGAPLRYPDFEAGLRRCLASSDHSSIHH